MSKPITPGTVVHRIKWFADDNTMTVIAVECADGAREDSVGNIIYGNTHFLEESAAWVQLAYLAMCAYEGTKNKYVDRVAYLDRCEQVVKVRANLAKRLVDKDDEDDNAPKLYDVDLETDTADTLIAIEQGDEAIRKAILWAFIRKSELSQLLQKPKDANGDIVFELPDGAYLLLQQAEDESLWWCTLFAVTEDAVHLDGYSDKGEAGVGKTIQEAFDDFMLCFKRMCKDLPPRYDWSSLMVLDQKVEVA